MAREGTITVREGARFKVDYQTYRLVRALDLSFRQGTDSEPIYLSGNPLRPEEVTPFDILQEGEDASVKRAAGRLAYSLAERYHHLAGKDTRKMDEIELREIEQLRNLFRFVD